MHTHPDQAHFVRCPKCVAKQKAREDALADIEKELANLKELDDCECHPRDLTEENTECS